MLAPIYCQRQVTSVRGLSPNYLYSMASSPDDELDPVYVYPNVYRC